MTDAAPAIDYASAAETQPAARLEAKPFNPPLPGLWVFLACLLIALLCNSGGLRGQGFIGAERDLVLNNDLLNRLPGLQSIWFKANSPSTYPLPQYAPMAQTLFFMEHALWGNTLWAYRLVSVVLHAGVGLMIWFLLRRLGIRGAAVAAMLFVAHPMTVDSISFIAERRNPVAALLGLSAAYLLLRASGVITVAVGKIKLLPDEPERVYGLACILFILGLCSNPIIATLPLVVLLIAWWKRGTSGTVLTTVCVALLVAGIGMLSLTSVIEKARAGVYSPASWNRAASTGGELAVRTQVAGRAVEFYAQKLIVPFPIALDYGRWQTPRDVEQFKTFTTDPARANAREMDVAPGDLVAWLFPLGVAAVVIASWVLRNKVGRGQFIAISAFILLLAPSLGFIDLGWMRYSFVINHAAYLAIIPLIAGIVWGGDLLLSYANDRTVTASSAFIVIAVCAVLSLFISLRFRNAPYFWTQNERTIPSSKSWWPRYEFAKLMLTEPDPRGFQLGTQALEDVRKYRPDEPCALVLLGLYRQRVGDEEGAMKAFQTSMQTFPNYAPAFYEAADSYRVQADLKPTDAKLRLTSFRLFSDAADRDPLDYRTQLKLGRTSWEVARRLDPSEPTLLDYFNEAALCFNNAVNLKPYDVNLLVEVSRTLIDMRKLSDAGSLLESARSIDPKRADVYELIAEAALVNSDLVGAEASLKTAIQLDPKQIDAYLRLGELRITAERWRDARTQFQKVLELDPNNAAAKRQLDQIKAFATTRPDAEAASQPSEQK